MGNCVMKKKYGSSPAFRLFDPGHPFEKIIRSWGASQVHRLPEAESLETLMPLEREISLTGTLQGTLVVRTVPEFAEWLQRQRNKTTLGTYEKTEIFEELISLYSLYLFHDFWSPLHFQIGSLRPVPSTPGDWPHRKPHAFCRYQVEGFPIEIRLWMKD